MPLEKFFSGEQPINVKDLTIENPEKEEGLPFDPEKEMTEDEIKEAERELSADKQNGDWYTFADRAATLRLLFPNRDVGLDEKTWGKIREELDASAEAAEVSAKSQKTFFGTTASHNIQPFLGIAADAEILFPGKVSRLEMIKNEWDNVWEAIETGITMPNWYRRLALARTAAVLFPAQTAEFPMDSNMGTVLRRAAKMEHAREEEPALLANGLATLKLFFKDAPPECRFDAPAWKIMKQDFHSDRWNASVESKFKKLLFALNLKILAADEIRFPENGGVEIVTAKPKPVLEPKTPTMPEQRNF